MKSLSNGRTIMKMVMLEKQNTKGNMSVLFASLHHALREGLKVWITLFLCLKKIKDGNVITLKQHLLVQKDFVIYKMIMFVKSL